MNVSSIKDGVEDGGPKEAVEEAVSELAGRVRPQLDEARRRLQALNATAVGFIKEHPAACLLGGVALGYLIARLARRERS
jgi:hypothetical protein